MRARAAEWAGHYSIESLRDSLRSLLAESWSLPIEDEREGAAQTFRGFELIRRLTRPADGRRPSDLNSEGHEMPDKTQTRPAVSAAIDVRSALVCRRVCARIAGHPRNFGRRFASPRLVRLEHSAQPPGALAVWRASRTCSSPSARAIAAIEVAAIDVYSGNAFVWAEAACWMLRKVHKPYVLMLHGGNLPKFAAARPARVKKLLASAAPLPLPPATCSSTCSLIAKKSR